MGSAISVIVSLFISLMHPTSANVNVHAQVKADEVEISPTNTQSVTPTGSVTISPTDTPSVTPSVSPSVSPTITPTTSPSVSPSISPTQDKDDQNDQDDRDEDDFKIPFGSIISGLAHEKNDIKEDSHVDSDTKVKVGE